ncbi:MAG: protein translocase subunit SecF [bacterium]|nr:protein translocase subunit SecF [bacterium]
MKPIYKIMFFVSIGLAITAIIITALFGLRFGTDFTGGSLMELSFMDFRPEAEDIQTTLKDRFENLGDVSISPAGEESFILRMKEIDENTHQDILTALNSKFPNLQEDRFDSIGGVIGQELKSKSVTAVILVLLLIVVYIGIVFRKLTGTLPPMAMGLAAILALLHDVLIPIGVFAFLGHYYGVEITAVFVAAVLTILGYSVSDTVVIFDRIRENILRFGGKENLSSLVHSSVMQTLTRSLNTSLTTLLSLLAIFFFGGETLKYFSLALIIGIFLGAYSSIFVASPILVWWPKRK